MPNPHPHESHPGTRLRSLMDAGCVPIPGAFNGAIGYAVKQAGFDAAYVSGGAISVAAGVPDVGLLTLEHFARIVEEVARSSGLPVLADADTGFGEAEMVRKTVYEYNRAGGAGLHIEDQVFPKRCGHLDGKVLVPTDHMCEKVAWAGKASQDCAGGAFIICARTDAADVDSFDAAVERAQAYVQAGADMIFPEGLTSEADFEAFARAIKSPLPLEGGGKGEGSSSSLSPRERVPSASEAGEGASAAGGRGGREGPYLLANMTEFGKTPIIPLSRFGEMGYDCVIFPVTTLRVTLGAVSEALAALKRDGHVESFLDTMMPRQDMYDLIGYRPSEPWELPTK